MSAGPLLSVWTAQTVQAEKSIQADVQQIVDVTFCPRFGEQERTDTGISVVLPGQMQMLYYDSNSVLQSVTGKVDGICQFLIVAV